MNKYIVPISDGSDCYISTFYASSIEDCQQKVVDQISEEYNVEYSNDYQDFLSLAYDEENIIVGDIIDIEEL